MSVTVVRRAKSVASPSMASLLALAAVAVVGPFLAPHDPNAQDLMRVMAPPSAHHWLGTDHVGRDVLSRALVGAPHSLGLAGVSVAIASGLGVGLGLLAAIGPNWMRALVLRLADLMLAMPGLLLALLLAGLMGGGVWPMLIGLNLALWPQYARMTEAVATQALREAHVEAARLAGFGPVAIARRHVLPRVIRQIMPLATLGVGSAIMSISALGFLGLGLRPPTPEWGAMINELLPYLAEGIVQMSAPCLAIFASVLTLTVVGRRMAADAERSRRHD